MQQENACDSHCAGRGMASNGNMNPDIRIDGSIATSDIWIAWNWVWAMVEISSVPTSKAATKADFVVVVDVLGEAARRTASDAAGALSLEGLLELDARTRADAQQFVKELRR